MSTKTLYRHQKNNGSECALKGCQIFFLRMLRSNATAGYAEVVTVKCYVVKCPRGEREGGATSRRRTKKVAGSATPKNISTNPK